MREVSGRRPAEAVMRLEEADPAYGQQPDNGHDGKERVALLVVLHHLAECPRRGEWDDQQQEDLEPAGPWVRALERVSGVGVEESAAVVAEVLDGLHGSYWPAGDGLVSAGQGRVGGIGVEVLDRAVR